MLHTRALKFMEMPRIVCNKYMLLNISNNCCYDDNVRINIWVNLWPCYTAYMDYMNLDVCRPRKAVKLDHSLTLSLHY